jgi:hypothetical protein
MKRQPHIHDKHIDELLEKHPTPWELHNSFPSRDISDRIVTIVDARGTAVDFQNIEGFRALTAIVNLWAAGAGK